MSDYEPKCKKTLPIIFDDRMPVNNLTPKLVGRVNDNTEDLKNLYEETDTMQGDIDSLQDDVDEKLDVPETAGTSGQVLTSDGEGGVIWASVGSGEIVVDPTLTVEGAAADAKKTGDEITHLKQDINKLSNTTKNLLLAQVKSATAVGVSVESYGTGRFKLNGTATSNGGRKTNVSGLITIPAGTYTLSVPYASVLSAILYLNKSSDNDNFAGVTVGGDPTTFTISEETTFYVGFGFINGVTYNADFGAQLEIGSSATDFVPSITAYDYFARKSVADYEAKNDATIEMMQDGYYPLDSSNFATGDINITSSGWTYYSGNNRVITKDGYTIPIAKGDIIKLTSYNGYRMYLGWRNGNGEYGLAGWLTHDFFAPEDGDYVIIIAKNPDAASTVSELFPLLKVYNGANLNAINNAKQKTSFIRGINHRGWGDCPENTLIAFKTSSTHGFDYVETDVQFTSDNVPVLLHDKTINRTARDSNGNVLQNTVYISDITYAEALTYDFGIYKGAQFAGTTIPSFEEFILLCKRLGLHAYVELKSDGSYTSAQLAILANIVKTMDMIPTVSWISFENGYIASMHELLPTARVGKLLGTISQDAVTNLLSLKTANNDVFFNEEYTYVTNAGVELCINNGIKLEVFEIDSLETIKSLNPYISGVTTNYITVGQAIYNEYI